LEKDKNRVEEVVRTLLAMAFGMRAAAINWMGFRLPTVSRFRGIETKLCFLQILAEWWLN